MTVSDAVTMKLNEILRRTRRKLSRGSPQMDDRTTLLTCLPRGAVGAEIGVWKGDFSERLLAELQPALLHLIDPWVFQSEFPDRMYGGTVAKGQRDMDDIHDQVVSRFRGDSRVRIHRGPSEVIMARFPEKSLDFIYIDGNHYFDYVRQDLELSMRVVRPGGFIAGDDYNWGESEGYPVRRAVAEFSQRHGLEGRLKVFGSQFVMDVVGS